MEKTANGIKKAVLNGANPILNNEIQKEFDPLNKKGRSSPERPQQKSKFEKKLFFSIFKFNILPQVSRAQTPDSINSLEFNQAAQQQSLPTVQAAQMPRMPNQPIYSQPPSQAGSMSFPPKVNQDVHMQQYQQQQQQQQPQPQFHRQIPNQPGQFPPQEEHFANPMQAPKAQHIQQIPAVSQPLMAPQQPRFPAQGYQDLQAQNQVIFTIL